MAFRQGRYGEVTVSGVSLSSYVDSVSFDRKADTLETTTFGKTAKTYIVGLTDASGDIQGKYDPTPGNGPAAVFISLIGANSVPFVLYPGGSQAGQVVRQFNAIVTDYQESSSVSDVIAFKASFTVDGLVIASGL